MPKKDGKLIPKKKFAKQKAAHKSAALYKIKGK